MVDLNGRFNLNNLVDGPQPVASQVQRYERLLRALRLDPGIAKAVVDWIDPDFAAGTSGAEDQRYLQSAPAYRAANRAFVHISELRLVRGITARSMRRSRPTSAPCRRAASSTSIPRPCRC